ncbi:molybdate ABC transporter substrate-binding protein [Corynebacterium poyangense]|uniref:Molybdate ABC transporter substrate-binding protein n=1 Tax=Corynebacterium poyangense TaxID=2684405 RepID=A0A7H0SNB5_9CORY|nr:molybdate ABC transporter substrate-binding protein [Corynebacterium poyangense]MBZ8177066.1 molybdate ABC transporter substrate-binding protein [Corynebacterium poyangense]QNQ90040.1 molybdate ABC transporter substrate-binding protein [Corynebacterium poyangense]
MNKFSRPALAALALGSSLALSACAPSDNEASSPDSTTLTVLGAASTRVLNDDLNDKVNHLPHPLTLNFVNAGSSTLVQQLVDGSPGDVLITADRRTMDDAIAREVVHDLVPAATNVLVAVTPRGSGEKIKDLTQLQHMRVVLCDPQVPCGAVAQQVITHNHLDIAPVSLEHSVSDALGKVLSGDADVAFVYKTDYLSAQDRLDYVELPGAEKYANEILVAPTNNSEHPEEALNLVNLLSSDDSDSLWEKYGFTPVKE